LRPVTAGTLAVLSAVLSLTGAAAGAQEPAAREFECLLDPHEVVDVGSPVFGVLDSVAVERGDSVRRGQLVAALKATAEEAAVALAEVRADFDRREVERNADLYRDELISDHDRDEIVTRSIVSELELAEAQAILELRRIESPMDGVIVERYLAPGEFVQQEPILRIAQIDPLNVEVVLPVTELGRVVTGMGADVLPDAPLNGSFRARVVIVDKVVDAASGTFGVRLELPNPGRELPAGLQCRVRFDPREPG
jgi:membrane fusion protein (multidrug efflux system)